MFATVWNKFAFLTTIIFVAGDLAVDMVRQENFPIESHYVTTEDGYILHLHRILPKRNISIENKYETTVMFFMHGLLESSLANLVRPNESAGYFFAERGFDVWLGNARGNMFSRNHTTLDPNEPPFWEFSFHEIGVYDLPATIDYILAVTNQTQLICIGHSQGTTSLFTLLSARPEYNSKIAIVHAMTPAIIFKYKSPLLDSLSPYMHNLEAWLVSNGYYELLSYETSSKYTKPFAELCVYPVMNNICKYLIEATVGTACQNCWYDRIVIEIATNIPAGASYRQFTHFGQMVADGTFQNYDHGKEKNMIKYGTPHPPEYNLSNINTKVHILYGTNDLLVLKENVPLLVKKIQKNVVAVRKLDFFNHGDVHYGKQVLQVQKHIFRVLKKHLKKT